MWALGCVLYEMCMLKHAFESDSLVGLVYRIVSDNYEPIPCTYSYDLAKLIRTLLDKSASNRPTTSEVLGKEFVRQWVSEAQMASQRRALEQCQGMEYGDDDFITAEEDAQLNPDFFKAPQKTLQDSATIDLPPRQPPMSPSTSAKIAPAPEGSYPTSEPRSPGRIAEKERQAWAEKQQARVAQQQQNVQQPRSPPPMPPAPPPVSSMDIVQHAGSPTNGRAQRRWTEQSNIDPLEQILIARVRRQLVQRKANWLQHFALFDQRGQGMLTREQFSQALTSLHLGLSEVEIIEIFDRCNNSNGSSGKGDQISLMNFNHALNQVNHSVIAGCEGWVSGLRKECFCDRFFMFCFIFITFVLSQGMMLRLTRATGSVDQLRAVFNQQPASRGRGLFTIQEFFAVLHHIDPDLNDEDIHKLSQWATKNMKGDIDWNDLLGSVEAPRPPGPPAAVQLPSALAMTGNPLFLKTY